jgi:hypothetical protein
MLKFWLLAGLLPSVETVNIFAESITIGRRKFSSWASKVDNAE